MTCKEDVIYGEAMKSLQQLCKEAQTWLFEQRNRNLRLAQSKGKGWHLLDLPIIDSPHFQQ